jgi:hypothetical protein
MKKFFLFAAAVVAALTVNAKDLDLAAVGTQIGDWSLGDQATLNSSKSDESKGKYVYDIAGGETANDTYIKSETGFVFQTKNTSKKEGAFSIYPGKCFEYGGKNGVLVIKGTAAGASIKLYVAAKGEKSNADFKDPEGVYPKNAAAVSTDLVLPAKNKGAEGADAEGYTWKTLEYKSMGGDVQIKEFLGGYRISKIEVSGNQAVENVEAEVKSVKTFENGQLVIIKNGVKYNALGAQL